MRVWTISALITGALTVAAAPARAEVRLTISEGYVTLDAKDATVRQILAEWSRVGQTRVVNGERVTGNTVTLQLTHVPEAEALDILLRAVAGYMAAPRMVAVPNASRFDRILVMPTSTPPRVTAPPAQQQAPPTFQPPPVTPDDLDVEPPLVQPPPIGSPGQPGPVFPQYPNTAGQPPGGFPQRGQTSPFQPGATPIAAPPPTTVPGSTPATVAGPPPMNVPGSAPATVPGAMPVGVSTPGMVVAPPPQPGQPTNITEVPR